MLTRIDLFKLSSCNAFNEVMEFQVDFFSSTYTYFILTFNFLREQYCVDAQKELIQKNWGWVEKILIKVWLVDDQSVRSCYNFP